ncbi:superoxide dismutase family protein [Estrella lausannensis]|uniref:Copper/zinc superoxide dismutase n=1 Tax=Estrella lausannensis TaxID=483423 RepID=A0A0H5DRA6_9BACT|nr:superoxide dismutase family protein [Estrella lausannensis]CRX38199.1 Copper/zinc superoxide dismutase [Estrella lausannensis]
MKKKLLTLMSVFALNPFFPLKAGHTEVFVTLQPVGGSQVSGQVRFSTKNEGVHIYGYIEGLNPGSHGLHIHEKGECPAGDSASVSSPSGGEAGHIADLGNVSADEDGIADFHIETSTISLEGPKSIVGKTLIILEGESAAGGRVACGLIHDQI